MYPFIIVTFVRTKCGKGRKKKEEQEWAIRSPFNQNEIRVREIARARYCHKAEKRK